MAGVETKRALRTLAQTGALRDRHLADWGRSFWICTRTECSEVWVTSAYGSNHHAVEKGHATYKVSIERLGETTRDEKPYLWRCTRCPDTFFSVTTIAALHDLWHNVRITDAACQRVRLEDLLDLPDIIPLPLQMTGRMKHHLATRGTRT